MAFAAGCTEGGEGYGSAHGVLYRRWAYGCAGTEVVQAIHEVGARLFNVHMKDLTSFQSKESQVAVGEGIMPVKKIFEALGAIKYKGFVDLEYEIHADDPMPGVIGSFAYMHGVMAGMG